MSLWSGDPMADLENYAANNEYVNAKRKYIFSFWGSSKLTVKTVWSNLVCTSINQRRCIAVVSCWNELIILLYQRWARRNVIRALTYCVKECRILSTTIDVHLITTLVSFINVLFKTHIRLAFFASVHYEVSAVINLAYYFFWTRQSGHGGIPSQDC